MNATVPFLDLITPHADLEAELIEVFRTALHSAAFVGGESVSNFEQNFVAVGSGTDALRFALLAGGVRPGDTVLTVANTFIATAEAITQVGAYPEFIEVDERSYNMSAEKLHDYLELCAIDVRTGARISRRTGLPITALLPVHLYGQVADMDGIAQVAEKFQLLLFEDACQAHGAEYFSKRNERWCKAGSMGKAAAFSFYPGKNLGACGEGGAVTTSDAQLAREMRMLRDHGQASKYYHDRIGYNGRLDSIQAGILDVKLKHLAQWTKLRRQAAARYNTLLASIPEIILPFVPEESRPVYHLYVIRVNHRERVQSQLSKSQIGTGIHYPVPIHLQRAYAELGYKKGDLPVTEMLSAEVLSLPMFPQITETDQEKVAEELAKAVSSQAQPVF